MVGYGTETAWGRLGGGGYGGGTDSWGGGRWLLGPHYDSGGRGVRVETNGVDTELVGVQRLGGGCRVQIGGTTGGWGAHQIEDRGGCGVHTLRGCKTYRDRQRGGGVDTE